MLLTIAPPRLLFLATLGDAPTLAVLLTPFLIRTFFSEARRYALFDSLHNNRLKSVDFPILYFKYIEY